MLTRREFSKFALAALPLASSKWPIAPVDTFSSKFNGVQIGVITYSYRSLRDTSAPWSPTGVDQLMDRVAKATAEDRINICEFWIPLIEPPSGPPRGPADAVDVQKREALRKWRASRPLDIFERARKKFNDAGVEIYSCMYNFYDDNTDDEIECAFDMAKALGTNIISANCTVASIKKVAPFADKHKIIVAAHSEDAPPDPNIDGMVFADNLVDALKLSPYIRVTLDIGHFTAYGGDALKFIREHHSRIANLHLKDRLKNHPEFHNDTNTPEWGKGNVPIKEVLQLMKREKYPFPACIEYEYKSDQSAVVEVKRCLEYAKAALV
jgi:sugar phosphate isomerase/epimerase